jgi:hypothetical protein
MTDESFPQKRSKKSPTRTPRCMGIFARSTFPDAAQVRREMEPKP